MGAAIRRLCWLVALALTFVSSGFAQDLTIAASLPFGAYYGSEEWTPITVDVRNRGSKEIVSTARLIPMWENAPETRLPLVVAGNSRIRTTMYAKLRPAADNLLGRIMLHDANGALLARTELVGRPVLDNPNVSANGIPEAGLAMSLSGEASQDETMDPQGIIDGVSAYPGWTLQPSQIDAASAPWSRLPYGAATFIQMLATDPDVISPVQRNALLTYVRGGGVLLVCAPELELVAGSWLEPLLPVRILGNREMNGARLTSGEELKYVKYVRCTEAVAGEGNVILADERFIHAAYREHGLGRIVFTSFPPSGLVVSQEQAGRLWAELLGAQRQPVGLKGTGIVKNYGPLMEPMLGRTAPARSIAMFAALGILGLVVVLHLIWRGASRPRAFVVSLIAAVVVSAGFAAAALLRSNADPLQQARLVVADVGEPGAFVNEFSAVSGPQQTVSRAAIDPSVALSLALLKQEQPLLTQFPMKLELIDVRPQQANLVTLAQGVSPRMRAMATGKFGADGLRLKVENYIGQQLESAQLAWGGNRMALPTLPTMESSTIVGEADLRPADEYTAASGLTSQDQQQKGQIVRELLVGGETTGIKALPWPTILAFVKDWPALTSIEGAELDRDTVQALLRIPVNIVASEPGAVRFDSVFTEMLSGLARGIPYDANKREFIRSAIQNSWLLGFQAPPQAGRFRPERATLNIDLASPQHTLRVRKGQAAGQKTPQGMGTPAGELVAEWAGEVGARSVTFDVTPADFDAQGILWLRLEVELSGGAGGLGVEPHWRINHLSVAMEGQIQP